MAIALLAQRNDPHLPVYLTRFFGRTAELDLLARLLENPDERLITLVGPGGVGKTRLLVEAVSRSSPGETIYVDGAALERPEFVLPALVDLLDIDPSVDRPSSEVLSEHLSGRRLTILFDNLEHLLDAAVDLAALVRALPGLRLVATSRAPMHISGERLVPLEPLATGGQQTVAGAASVAAQLFIDRATLTGKLDEPTEADLALIETICARLDGLPLAIELAAARLRALSLPALLALLTNQLAVLTGGPRDTSARHHALRATIAWSYDLLDEDEQRLLRELGVFTESFALQAVNAVCTPAERETIDLLESLFDQALLMRAEDELDGEPRYRMLTAIRDFALDRLREAGEETQLRARHAAWFLELAETLEPDLTGAGQLAAIEWLDRATPNLRQALEFMIDQKDQESALRLATALNLYWMNKARLDEARDAFTAIFALGDPRPTTVWGAALRSAAVDAELRFDNETALDRIRQAIAIWEELGDAGWTARSRIDLGNVYNNLGRFDDAIAEFELAAALADPVTSRRTHIIAIGSIASALIRKGALQESDRVFTEVLPLMRQLEDRWPLAMFLANGAVARQRLGNYASARALLEESLELGRQLGDEHGIASALINLCEIEKDPAIIERNATQALELAQGIGSEVLAAAARINLGDLARSRGNLEDAARFYIAALDGYSSIHEELAQADVIGLIASMGMEHDPVAATCLLGAVLGIHEVHGSQPTGDIAERMASARERLRRQMGSEVFDRDISLGRAMTLAEARVDALTLARQSLTHPGPATADKRHAGELTPRELEVLRLITLGNTDKEIAEALFITPKTANHHVTRILAKLECRNRAAATALALQRGLVESGSAL